MAQLTYAEARDSILETTQLGYTLRSLDRLWIVFRIEGELDGVMLMHSYGRIYPLPREDGRVWWSYDLFDDELVWTTRREAEAFAAKVRDELVGVIYSPEVYVMNLGDARRLEAFQMHDSAEFNPRFAGSTDAIAAYREAQAKWPEVYAKWAQLNNDKDD